MARTEIPLDKFEGRPPDLAIYKRLMPKKR
jgi:hypothetical protein